MALAAISIITQCCEPSDLCTVYTANLLVIKRIQRKARVGTTLLSNLESGALTVPGTVDLNPSAMSDENGGFSAIGAELTNGIDNDSRARPTRNGFSGPSNRRGCPYWCSHCGPEWQSYPGADCFLKD